MYNFYMQRLYNKELPNSCLRYILEGLIPYTKANMKLTFRPHQFFNDLEKISKRKERSLRNAFYKATKQGFIEAGDDGIPRLTKKGRAAIKPYRPKILKNAKLMVIFDIPEIASWKRRHIRLLLKELSFQQIQKSVWESEYDHREYLTAEIRNLKLENCIKVYEAVPIIDESNQ